jgi:hypothetical protein
MIDIDVDHFRARLIQDCLTEATASYWIHRAHQFQQAAPKPGEFHGRATRAQLVEAHRRCNAIALACRRRAQLIMDGRTEEISTEVLETIAEAE